MVLKLPSGGKYISILSVVVLNITAPVPTPLAFMPVAVVFAFLVVVDICGINAQGDKLFSPALLKSTTPVSVSPNVPNPTCDVLA